MPSLIHTAVLQVGALLYFASTVTTNVLVAVGSYERWRTLRVVKLSLGFSI